jgi:hypothetical protein
LVDTIPGFSSKFLKSGKWLTATFLKGFLELRDMCRHRGKGERNELVVLKKEFGKFKSFWCSAAKNFIYSIE